jgi:hypothetical protein
MTRKPVVAVIFVLGALLSMKTVGSAKEIVDSPRQISKQQAEKPPTVISLSVAQSHFEPSVLHLRIDERYELHVESADTTRGIRISPFPEGAEAHTAPGLFFANGEDCWKLPKGETVLIGVVPTEPGNYIYSSAKAAPALTGK